MVGQIDFEVDGRVYACRLEPASGARKAAWWWFTVSGDTHRYAPFRAEKDDTPASVRDRVVAYYTNHLTRRAEPQSARSSWGRRPSAPAKPDAPGTTTH